MDILVGIEPCKGVDFIQIRHMCCYSYFREILDAPVYQECPDPKDTE